MSGGSGDIIVSVQTVRTRCTLVQPENHSTVALDWTRVGGVVQECEGWCMTNVTKWEPKYVPNWDNLPRWEHPRFKPNCSRRYETIYLGGNGDTIPSPYLLNNPAESIESRPGRGDYREELERRSGGLKRE